ncbi:putative MFS myo-inositol transporter [Aureobasidium pullulans]|nr:putative MFS myo-inositol transporter [Aureobasidium pullulans]
MANEKLSYDRKSAGPEGETNRIDIKDERSSGSASPEPSHEATLWERQRDPYLGKSERDVITDLEGLVQQYDLHDLKEELARGARYAYNRDDTDRLNPTEDERHWIVKEKSPAFKDKWAQTKMMYFVAFLCGSAAIVQGMDQTAVNGAQLGYFEDFNITNEWEQGLINGAPYLCSVLIGCWTSPVLNKYFGRRGTIWISCFVSIASGAWQGATFDKWQLFASRFVGGFAIGAKSSTTPAYAAECSPPRIRGALGSQWQMWTAFGIMLGFIASVAFYGIEVEGYPGLDWRLMLASTSIPPIFVCCMTFFAPESPRWLMSKGGYREAFQSLCRLRQCHLHAARDLYDIHIRLMLEHELKPKTAWARATKLFSVPRNRRAAQSAFFVMLMQQFCGVNVIAYYSSAIFVDAGFTVQRALLASMGTGIINWLFAIPGILTIDTKGRRWLLLVTFPYMAACLFFTGFSFFIPEDRGDARIACVATGIYLFMVGYSPGMGPVPFTYSAESFPLAVRDTGMAFATATCWGFNFILALTWPALQTAFTTQGAFCWYAAWNLFGFVFTWFCLPETKARPLEELDAVFNIRTRDHFAYHLIKTPVIGKGHVGNNLADVAAVIEGRDVKGHV